MSKQRQHILLSHFKTMRVSLAGVSTRDLPSPLIRAVVNFFIFPLNPVIKIQTLICYLYTFPIEEVGRIC